MKYLSTYLLLLLTATVSSEELVPIVNMQTNLGIIVMELYPQQAPKTVENFLRYAQEGFYEGTLFHRVIKNFIVQGGGYTTDYTKKPTYDPIVNESNNGLSNLRGYVAMARSFDDPESATSQFFINVNDNYSLDYQELRDELGYAVFGQVIKGMDIVDKIQSVKTGAFGQLRKNVPQEPIVIVKLTIDQGPPQTSFPQQQEENVTREKETTDDEDELETEATETTDEEDELETEAAADDEDELELEATEAADDKDELELEATEAVEEITKTVKENTQQSKNKSMASPQTKKFTQPPDAPSKPDKPEPPST